MAKCTPNAQSDRLAWALLELAKIPHRHVLEIGCGPGRFLQEAAERYPDIELAGFDRSQRAIDSAAARCAMWVETGRVSLESVDSGIYKPRRRYDVIVALNVNAFWIGPTAAIGRVADWLETGGHLLLGIDAPSSAQAGKIYERMVIRLPGLGFDIEHIEQQAERIRVICTKQVVGKDL